MRSKIYAKVSTTIQIIHQSVAYGKASKVLAIVLRLVSKFERDS